MMTGFSFSGELLYLFNLKLQTIQRRQKKKTQTISFKYLGVVKTAHMAMRNHLAKHENWFGISQHYNAI